MWFDFLIGNHLVPDALVRFFIWTHFFKRRVQEPRNVEKRVKKFKDYIEIMNSSPIALVTEKPNEQHYELPTEFFQYCLGPHMKYSSCIYPKRMWRKKSFVEHLERAEQEMLELTCQRAHIHDGDKILDVGCGWGSLSLFMARKYPNSKITAVSNSSTQKEYIDNVAQQEGLQNIHVITADMKDFTTEEKFDRITSVEMFEHMRNYGELLNNLSSFLRQNGTLFIHIFAYRGFPYLMEVKRSAGFITKYFFTGGMMPSDDLLLFFTDNFRLREYWPVNGRHYYKTLMAWLEKMKMHKREIIPILKNTYGEKNARKWWNFWRMFYISCGQMFKFARGNRWIVAHYLFEKTAN